MSVYVVRPKPAEARQAKPPLIVALNASPDLLGLAARRPDFFPALLCTRGATGWDILFAWPREIVRIRDAAELAAHPAMQLKPAAVDPTAAHPALPFTGGWLAFFAYEFGAQLEPTVAASPDATTDADPAGGRDAPLAWLARIPAAVMVNRATGEAWLVAETRFDYDMLRCNLKDAATPLLPVPVAVVEDAAETYLAAIARIQDYIRAGDVFQVNVSRAWRARFADAVNPAALFARLCEINPAPFAALLNLDLRVGGQAVVSASPERLFRIEGRRILTRPIAGTHPRLDDPEADAAQKARLIAHPKERAEHVMLVDLERNDLGRVCEAGSVVVEAMMEIASYTHVHHIESTVAGMLRADATLYDVIRALFPGGTITGCPKVRTMQIIAELEDAPRRAYTGSLGYINHDGSADFNILIRSFWVDGDRVEVRAGAGIVADSDPQRELQETRAKAEGLLRALAV